ncbi:MAG TPA: DNA-processing protein DprA, partial [Saprospiraceae bacterium]|nr:DNA-processing protein DprA [Saprospiraceae bacterium]
KEKTVFEKADREISFIEENNIKPLFFLDPDYPKALLPMPDSPVMLYLKGNTKLNGYRTVGIVGTRKPTPEGIANCEAIVEYLKSYGVQIISGLAYGIDATAHRKAVEYGIPNIGVLGHGLDMIYPHNHRSLAKSMENCGGLLSEFPSKTEPDKERFPMRNRIIAGLSDAVIVVETASSGGSMITADMAFNYNKDVFAVPGRPKDKYSQGCNLLIKQNKAALIDNAKDFIHQMMWDQLDKTKEIQTQLFTDLDSKETVIVENIKQKQKATIDELAFTLNTSQSEMAALLLNLEFKGIIKSIPGKRFILS